MQITRTLFTIALAACLALPATRAAYDLPADFRVAMIWIKVVADRANAPLNFLLDSGAGTSVVDLAAARRLGLELGRQQSVQGVHSRSSAYPVKLIATAGEESVPRTMLALDLGGISRSLGRRVDGLLGADFFRDRIIQVDYRAHRLLVLTRSEVRTECSEILGMTFRNGAMCVRAGIADCSNEWMRVDTGCDSALEWVAGTKKAQRWQSPSIAVAVGSAHTAICDVRLGSETIVGVKAGLHDQPMFAGEAGLLGNGLLANFSVTFDAAKRRLILAR